MTSDLMIIPPEDNPYDLEVAEYLFVEEFLTTFDGPKAARAIGLKNPNVTARKLLKRPEILLAIRDGLDTRLMGSSEILLRLSQMARSDLADFAKLASLDDLDSLRNKGVHTHVVKKFKKYKRIYANGDEEESLEIELYDSMRAMQLIGKYHRMFDDYVKQLNVNLDDLNDDQLRRLAEGEDLIKVLMAPPDKEE